MLKNLPLGWPLTIAAAGTCAAAFMGGKRLHIALGVTWSVLSILHGLQHRKTLKKNAVNLAGKLGCRGTKSHNLAGNASFVNYPSQKTHSIPKTTVGNNVRRTAIGQ